MLFHPILESISLLLLPRKSPGSLIGTFRDSDITCDSFCSNVVVLKLVWKRYDFRLQNSDHLIRSELGIMFCILEDILEDEDFNQAREELKSITKKLGYLVLDEG